MERWQARAGWLVLGAAFLLVLAGTRYLAFDLRVAKGELAGVDEGLNVVMPPNLVLRAAAMGYEPFVADVLFMEAHSFFASRLTRARSFDWLDIYFGAMAGYCSDAQGQRQRLLPDECAEAGYQWEDGVFPFNPRVYLWAAQAMKFVGTDPQFIDVAVYYGKVGIHFCPDSWELYYDVGSNLYSEYKKVPDDVIEAKKREGLNYLVLAAGMPNSRVNRLFVSSMLYSKHGFQDMLNQIYTSYFDSTEDERFQMRWRLKTFETTDQKQKEYLESLFTMYEEGDKLWNSEMNFMPQSLFHVIGSWQPMVPTALKEVP